MGQEVSPSSTVDVGQDSSSDRRNKGSVIRIELVVYVHYVKVRPAC